MTNTTQTDIFAILEGHRDAPSAMIDAMVDHFRAEEKPQELFEALKMQVRDKLGLPAIVVEQNEDRPEEIEQQLEHGLLQACREAGQMLINQGRVGEGWMYLRPTGDFDAARQFLADVEITDDNYDEMIQVLLHEGVDVARGYQAVLDHQGTCNSITLYEQALVQRSKADRKAAAACLLEHFYNELTTMVRGDIARREKPAGDDESLLDMIESRKWLLEDGGYHLDTTHLSATVKIATLLEEPEQIQKVWELCQYGRRLHHQFQYPGEEPFLDFYPAHLTFFSILRGENVDAGLKMFQRKAQTVDTVQHGTGAIETYVDLLTRVGRHVEAVQAAVDLVPNDVPPQRIIPMLLEIAEKAKADGQDATEPILQYCQKHGDVLGFAAVVHAAKSSKP
tara:strand:+ start:299542 stop:300723 length:1182 start_codon:yes stop_codon:yes gene_type:complete